MKKYWLYLGVVTLCLVVSIGFYFQSSFNTRSIASQQNLFQEGSVYNESSAYWLGYDKGQLGQELEARKTMEYEYFPHPGAQLKLKKLKTKLVKMNDGGYRFIFEGKQIQSIIAFFDEYLMLTFEPKSHYWKQIGYLKCSSPSQKCILDFSKEGGDESISNTIETKTEITLGAHTTPYVTLVIYSDKFVASLASDDLSQYDFKIDRYTQNPYIILTLGN